MPPEAWPSAQSTQTESSGFAAVVKLSDVCRHAPTFLRSHHAGRAGAAVVTSTMMFDPVFAVQANARLDVPPSPSQRDQRRLTPPPSAEVASRASARDARQGRSLRTVPPGHGGGVAGPPR